MSFNQKIITWFAVHGRKTLPWQKNPSAYRVYVSEIMLQQTQVNTVIPYFERFMTAFPNIKALSLASVDEVLTLWTGLGYYARARNLHKTAQIIQEQYKGRFPKDIQSLIALPGIGRSTAGAILALSQQQRHPILDGNVKRVLCRHFAIEGWSGHPTIEKELWEISDSLTPHKEVHHYTQAMMDIGATLCTRTRPKCELCPVKTSCMAKKHNRVSEFPYQRPKQKEKPKKSITVLLLISAQTGSRSATDPDSILLEKRPSRGIWGGLWSLPELPEQASLKNFCRERFNLKVDAAHSLQPIPHSFTHFHLLIHPLLCRVSMTKGPVKTTADQAKPRRGMAQALSSECWYPLNGKLTIGLAAPIKRLLEEIQCPIKSIA